MGGLVTALALVGVLSMVHAASYDDVTSGAWNSDATWGLSNGSYPQAGDRVTLNSGVIITVSGTQQFGGADLTSNWNSPGSAISFSGGGVLEHLAGGLLDHNAHTPTGSITGTGIFRNYGTFYDSRNGFNITGGATFENYGINRVGHASNSGMVLAAGTTYRNLDGTLRMQTGGGASIRGDGVFTTMEAGAAPALRSVVFDIESGASLAISTTGSGRAHVSAASKVDGTLTLAGLGTEWSGEVNGAGRVSLTQFTLGGDLAIKTTGSDTTANFGPSVFTSELNGHTLSLHSANLLALGGHNFTWQNGTLLADSQTHIAVSRGNTKWYLNNMQVEHVGIMEFRSTSTYTDFLILDANTTFRSPGGTLYSSDTRATTGLTSGEIQGAGVFTTRDSGGTLHSMKLLVDPGARMSFTTTGSGGRADFAAASVVDGTLHINSATQWSGTVNGSGRLDVRRLDLGGDLTVNLTGTGNFNNATSDFGGHKLTLGAGMIWSEDHDITWKNGTLEISAGASVSYDRANGNLKFDALTVNNYGTFQFRPNWTSTATVQLNNGSVFNNYGTVTKLDNATPRDTDGGSFAGGTGTFNNYGIVRLLDEPGASTLSLSGTSVGQLSGGVLSGGTWHVAGEGSTILLPGGNNSITTIGNGATVIIEDGGKINAINAGNTGLTTLNGTLILNGTASLTKASGILTVGATGRLTGNGGTITGNVVVDGTIAPGNSIGIFNIDGNLTLNGTYELEIDKLLGTADLLAVTGILTIGDDAVLDISYWTYQAGEQSLLIATATGGISGSFDNVLSPAGYNLFLSNNGTELWLSIPEPASALLLAIAGLALLRRRHGNCAAPAACW